MTPEQALQLLGQLVAQTPAIPAQVHALEEALETLERVIIAADAPKAASG